MKKIKQLILISMCTIGTFLSSSSIYAVPPKFTPETDEALIQAVAQVTAQGPLSWTAVAKLVPHQTARSCRTRWTNYICPIQIASWTRQEDELLLTKYEEFGPQWRIISNFFTNRSEMSVKNRYYLIRRNFNCFDLLNCSFRVKVHGDGTKKLFCELKETSDTSDSKIQKVAIAAIKPSSTERVYANALDWEQAPFSLAMDISEMEIIDQALPDCPKFQELMEQRYSFINDQIIKNTGTVIVSSHKAVIYDNKH